MSIKWIIIDSLSYPFSNWKRSVKTDVLTPQKHRFLQVLILGIIILICFSPYIALYLVKVDFLTFILLNIIGFIFIGSFVRGYALKIISDSLTGSNELPKFNNWKKIFIDGIKVLVVNLIYLIPVILIVILLFRYSGSNLNYMLTGLLNLNLLYGGFSFFLLRLITLLYLLMIIPVILMALANMASNNGKFGAAFKFNEIISNVSKLSRDSLTATSVATAGLYIPMIIGFLIFDDITDRIISINYKKFIIWYIAIGVISLALILFGYFIANFTSILILNAFNLYSDSNYNILRISILSLVFLPYFLIFISRSTALIYNSAIKSYLIRENYIGNYDEGFKEKEG